MPGKADACEAKRADFIRLLQGDELEEWRITETALRDGRRILPEYQGHFGAYAVNLFIPRSVACQYFPARCRTRIGRDSMRHEHPFAGRPFTLYQAGGPR